ncbi:MAG: NAD-dependent epimerase/dehydratase family protein [Sandaracinaceae bacterium]|nr:NAD-dependent epimerase/dehydratase family protein [Sandaracinaceae bacterium]
MTDASNIAVVTGGAGRLGCALVRHLLDEGARVRVLDPARDPVALEGLDVERVAGSVLDRGAVDRALEGASVVYHCAAKVDLMPDRDGSIRAVNVDGTRAVAEACAARSIRMVHTSSHAALDRRPLSEPLTEDNPLALDDACDYHRSKAHGEKLVLDLARRGDLDAVIVSPGTLTGPWDFGPSIFGKALIDLRAGRIPVLLDAVTDYADVRDVARAVAAASSRGRRGERYLLTGDVRDIRGLARSVEAVTGRKMPRVALPIWVGWAMLPITNAVSKVRGEVPLYSAGMLRASVSNAVVRRDKAERELGFRLRSMEGSLADAFAFYDEQGWR